MIRTPPGPLLLAAALGAAALAVTIGLAGEDQINLFPVTSLVALLAGLARSRAVGGGAFAVVIAGVAIGDAISPDAIVPELMLPAAMFFTGLALAGRERVAERLAVQAAELEAERETYNRLSVRYERARIAAELHDVVAHAISVMVVQASAGQRLAVADPGAAEATFAVIGEAARLAEADLDRLAALLSEGGSQDAQSLRLVEELVAQAQSSGLPVTLRVTGAGDGVQGAIAHAACRVVQEGLTNALRYAPGAPVRVGVDVRPARIDVAVTNEPPAGAATPGLGLGSGRGLTGLRERVAACGGTLEAGPDSAGGWAVIARIPRVASRTADRLVAVL